ncbi:MAG: outer membrane beta-barrel protein [Oleiphilaceae bacterium]|nr:outer membrane beta-barrel protein [Oleiphilaceae bacterium]
MKKTTAVVAALSLATLLPLSAMAENSLNYNFIQADYISINTDDSDIDADGFGVLGSGLISDEVFFFGGLAMVETDPFTVSGFRGSVELRRLELGLGYRHELQPGTDFNVGASFLRDNVEGNGDFSGFDFDDENGYSFNAKLRHRINAHFELGGGARYVDIADESDTGLDLNALVHLNHHISFALGYTLGSDEDTTTVGARLNF